MLRLINDILDMSKLESGKMNYKKEKYDLSVVINNAIVELKPLLQDKELQISTNFIADSSDAVFDRYRITQVLVNLLSNAIKFSDKGKQIQIHLSEGYMPDGNPVLSCSVIDEGPGIPGTELTTVFNKFTQGKKIKSGGTGLGLAICREIVEAHEGMIWVENVQPRGASFNFCIPRSSVASVHLGGRRESQAIGC